MSLLSPSETRTQTYNLRGRIRSTSPQTNNVSAVSQAPVVLNEVTELPMGRLSGLEDVESSDQTLVNGGSPEHEVVTSDGESGVSSVSAALQATAHPFLYQTPIRSRTNQSFFGDAITQETPIGLEISNSRGMVSTRQAPAAQNSVSPTARMTHLGRSTATMLSGSPSLPSPSGYTLSMPHHQSTRRTTVSVRGGTNDRRDERSVSISRRRPSENAENEPIAQDDEAFVMLGISSPSARPFPGQLNEALDHSQR